MVKVFTASAARKIKSRHTIGRTAARWGTPFLQRKISTGKLTLAMKNAIRTGMTSDSAVMRSAIKITKVATIQRDFPAPNFCASPSSTIYKTINPRRAVPATDFTTNLCECVRRALRVLTRRSRPVLFESLRPAFERFQGSDLLGVFYLQGSGRGRDFLEAWHRAERWCDRITGAAAAG